MQLVDGKTYISNRGIAATIGGTTKDHPEWVWSIQGDWYDRATGRRIAYTVDRATNEGRHVLTSYTGDDLVKELK